MDFAVYLDNFLLIMILTVSFSFLIDLFIGDPKSKYHPVMLIGKTIEWFKQKFRTGKSKLDKLLGVVLLMLVIMIFCIPIFFLQILIWWFWNFWNPDDWYTPSFITIISISLIMGFLLKWPFAVKSMGKSTLPISKALLEGDLQKARTDLSLIVRRDTDILSEDHIISATVECIAESSTDAITSVIWFYFMGNLIGFIIFIFFHNNYFWLFLGLPLAYSYRVINTADSVVGYKDPEHINIGWFSARIDDFANFIPTRLTVLFMLIAGKIMKKDAKNGWNTLKSDRGNTESVNAGWTMGTMAGLLNIQLEKIGKYKLGIPTRALEPKDIVVSYRIFLLTVFLYVFTLLIITILIISLLFLL